MVLYYHYTNERGANAIRITRKLRMSTRAINPTDARRGDGVYFTRSEKQRPIKKASWSTLEVFLYKVLYVNRWHVRVFRMSPKEGKRAISINNWDGYGRQWWAKAEREGKVKDNKPMSKTIAYAWAAAFTAFCNLCPIFSPAWLRCDSRRAWLGPKNAASLHEQQPRRLEV